MSGERGGAGGDGLSHHRRRKGRESAGCNYCARIQMRCTRAGCLETYAFFDNGSSATFCSESLLKQLKAKSKEIRLSMTTASVDNEIWRSAADGSGRRPGGGLVPQNVSCFLCATCATSNLWRLLLEKSASRDLFVPIDRGVGASPVAAHLPSALGRGVPSLFPAWLRTGRPAPVP